MVLRDLNARTADVKGNAHHLDCASDDHGALNSQGHGLIALSLSCNLVILNGITSLGLSNGGMTSFQSKDTTVRVSVIDYGLCNEQAWPMVVGFSVGQKEPWSDHAALALAIHSPAVMLRQELHHGHTQTSQRPPLPPALTPLDELMMATVRVRPSLPELCA
jgi:hypothetical protein